MLDNRGTDHLADFHGLISGSAFIQRGFGFDFVGVNFEFSSNYEFMYFRHYGFICINWQIEQYGVLTIGSRRTLREAPLTPNVSRHESDMLQLRPTYER